jgi:hypothetical protein
MRREVGVVLVHVLKTPYVVFHAFERASAFAASWKALYMEISATARRDISFCGWPNIHSGIFCMGLEVILSEFCWILVLFLAWSWEGWERKWRSAVVP